MFILLHRVQNVQEKCSSKTFVERATSRADAVGNWHGVWPGREEYTYLAGPEIQPGPLVEGPAQSEFSRSKTDAVCGSHCDPAPSCPYGHHPGSYRCCRSRCHGWRYSCLMLFPQAAVPPFSRHERVYRKQRVSDFVRLKPAGVVLSLLFPPGDPPVVLPGSRYRRSRAGGGVLRILRGYHPVNPGQPVSGVIPRAGSGPSLTGVVSITSPRGPVS